MGQEIECLHCYQGSISGIEATGPGLLRQFFARSIHCNGQMHVGGFVVIQHLLQKHLSCCRVQEINATDDFRDFLRFVIDDNSKLIGKEPVAASQDEITCCLLQILATLSL